MTCDECNYSVQSAQQLREHIQLNHLVSKRFFHCYETGIVENQNKFVNIKCSQCDYNFESKKQLKSHILRVHYEKTFECNLCDELFTRDDNLERHKKEGHT